MLYFSDGVGVCCFCGLMPVTDAIMRFYFLFMCICSSCVFVLLEV